ncbi:MAG TPA: hypothetical protein VGJ66_15130 [Pyrinomonadaceae bacterium]|jgi:hypothetical protein
MLLRRTILITVLLGSALLFVHAQSKHKWQRVYTGDDSVIEVNASSLILERDHVLRADFRTILAKSENIAVSQGAKYKSRIETIRFKLNDNRYCLGETTWFDAKGTKLHSYTPAAEDWRVLKRGGVMERLFHAARTLPPYGSWKVIAYRFAEGSPANKPEPALEKVVGTRVRLQANRAEVGGKVCSSLAYEDKRVSNEELNRELGVRLAAIGINAEYIETTKVKCEGGGWTPPQSLLMKLKEREMLMLWNGVFLVLQREREWTGDILPPLKRVKE